ncbi:MAG: DUF4405 domain-containing protein [Candidatus Nanoarchaeia archaeon]|nr:DUF4405 domain-containing protein [Candidatus Nanoarchaeia archaeon]
MDRTKLNYLIDIGLLISGIIVIVTGILKLEIFRLRLMNLNIIHDWSGIIFAVFVLIHLVLHFKWLIAVTKKS